LLDFPLKEDIGSPNLNLVIDTMEMISAVSLTPGDDLLGVIDTAEIISVV
jgi:hypothetical protein